jgi:hypothetical protein
MPENQSRFVWIGQQAFAFAVAATVAVSAVGVTELEIVAPAQQGPQPTAPESTLVAAAPVEPAVREVPLSGGTSTGHSEVRSQSRTGGAAAQEIRVVSEPEPVEGFGTVGVTWKDGQRLDEEDVQVSVRTRQDGAWSQWQEMHFDADHAPDPGSPDAGGERAVREGTDAVVVGDVDDVQVRAVAADGRAPKGLSLSIVDPGEEAEVDRVVSEPAAQQVAQPASQAATVASDTTQSARLAAAVPRPQIFTRKDWGADERLRDGAPQYGEIHAGFVHHTVNANTYDRDDVPGILRGIYAYHTQSRGWSDVGYNFLVDRFGRIWEGRAGGIDRPVVGAHTLGYNSDSFAMSAIGNFETVRPSEAVVDAYAALMAWKLSLHGVAADDTRQFVTSRYFQAINGHRDAGSTACPGRNLYAKLGAIRRTAASIQKTGTAPTPTPTPQPEPEPTGTPLNGNLAGLSWPDLVVRDAVSKHVVLVPTGGQLAFVPGGSAAATGWARVDLVAAAGDIDRDGRPDLVARFKGSKKARDFTIGKAGSVRRAGHTYTRFKGLDQLTGVGDLTGDRRADLVGRRAKGKKLVLFAGRGNGAFAPAKVLAGDWRRYDATVGVDDLDGDGRRDLVARSGDTLYLVRGTARGIAAPRALPGSFAGYDRLAGRGDVTGDGHPDLVVRLASTKLVHVLPGDGAGGFGPRIGGWSGFESARWLGIAGQVTGSSHPDLMALGGGTLAAFAHHGRSNVARAVDTRAAVGDADLVLNAGDWNGDGRGDVVTRDAKSGELHLRAVRKDGTLADPVLIGGPTWGTISHVTAVGDVTGDRKPDLAGLQDGTFRVYHGNGTGRFKRNNALPAPFKATGLVNLGRWDGDKVPDIGYRRFDGTLWMVPRGGGKAVQIASNLRRYDWLRGLGDLDGDGRTDLVVRRKSDGDLMLLRRQGDTFAEPRLIATGFGRYDLG